MAQFNFVGKTALVTGAGRGIGRSIAKALAASGAVTYALSRSQEPLDSLVKEQPLIRPVCADLSNWDNTKKEIEALGPIDLLVNNAGVLYDQPFLEVDEKTFDRTMEVNVKSVVAASQVVARGLIARKCAGAIVNVSSISGIYAYPNFATYCSSKAALEMLSKVMAVELGKHQIRVNCVNPTIVNTDMAKHVDPATMAPYIARIPLGRIVEPDEVSSAVLFLLSDSASMMNGASLMIDGGCTVHTAP